MKLEVRLAPVDLAPCCEASPLDVQEKLETLAVVVGKLESEITEMKADIERQFDTDFVARNRRNKCGAKWPQSSVSVGLIHTRGMRSQL